VLTDYHLHLRPDNVGRASEAFTEENVDRYLAAASEHGIDELGVSEHIYRFSEALEVWRHPYWQEQARDDLGEYCDFVASTPLKLGIEADFVRGGEDKLDQALSGRPFDYIVGSVHFLGDDGAVDDTRYDIWSAEGDPSKLWKRYFAWIADAARSGLFDILAHPDLIKIWGEGRPSPDRDPRFYYEPAIEAIAESGVAVEISTAGLRKPVGELYPSRAFAEMCVEAGADFALSSDAHAPDQVGYGYDRALEFLADLGIERICVFEGRSRRLEHVGRTGLEAGEGAEAPGAGEGR
jgi:histidinol-phosphatase (PHP family)